MNKKNSYKINIHNHSKQFLINNQNYLINYLKIKIMKLNRIKRFLINLITNKK